MKGSVPRILRKSRKACGVRMSHHVGPSVVWAEAQLLIYHLSPALRPMASSWNVSSMSATDKNGRPVTFVQALWCFTAISKDGMSSVLRCKDILSVPEIRPYIEELGLPGGSDGKESACNAENLGSISGLRSSPGGRHDNPLQYSCLENFMDRGAWQATVYGVAKSQTWLRD